MGNKCLHIIGEACIFVFKCWKYTNILFKHTPTQFHPQKYLRIRYTQQLGDIVHLFKTISPPTSPPPRTLSHHSHEPLWGVPPPPRGGNDKKLVPVVLRSTFLDSPSSSSHSRTRADTAGGTGWLPAYYRYRYGISQQRQFRRLVLFRIAFPRLEPSILS